MVTLQELLESKAKGTSNFPGIALLDLLGRRDEPLNASFNPSGIGPGISYGSLASILADMAPGIGDWKSAADALSEAGKGNYGAAGISALGALPLVGVGAIKAYHGSPHQFDAFDLSKVGSGEGAQMYGHGLYFAESPDVASYYSSKNPIAKIGRKPIYKYQENITGPYVNDKYTALDDLQSSRWKKNPIGLLEKYRNSGEYPEDFLKWLEKNVIKKYKIDGAGGNVYEVSLEWPDAEKEASDPLSAKHFIDWDKTLGEQSKDVLDMLEYAYPGITTRDAKESMPEVLGRIDKHISAHLNDSGIPGIRYLDQMSRTGGEGTQNYVVFDDRVPKIISRRNK